MLTDPSPPAGDGAAKTLARIWNRAAESLFFFQMAGSSALALLRGFVLALLLVPASFGSYALLVSIGTFSASLLSFGQIERSFKRFPRLFVDGHAHQALAEADAMIFLLARRGASAALILLAILFLIGRGEWALGALCATGAAFTVAMQSAYISVHRASGELSALGQSALARTVLALLFAAVGAIYGSWAGAMIGEILAAALGGWISRAYVRGSVNRVGTAEPIRPSEPANKELWLFSAFIIVSVPLYLDRAMVSLFFGNGVTGSYALLMLFVTAAATMTSIVSQKLGPQLIRLERSNAPLGRRLRLLAAWVLAISALATLGVGLAAVALLEAPLASLGEKYQLTGSLMLAAAAMSAAQVSHLFEWMLISHDRERGVFFGGLLYVSALGAGLALAWTHAASLEGFMWVMAGGKLLHVTVLAIAVLRLPRATHSSARVQA